MAAHSDASMPASQAASSSESPHCWRVCWMALANPPAQKRRRIMKFAEGAIWTLSEFILIYPHSVLIYSILRMDRRCQAPRRPHKFDYLSEYGIRAGDYQRSAVITSSITSPSFTTAS